MSTLIRWDPRRELDTLRNEFDRFFGDRFVSDPFFNAPAEWSRDLPAMRLALDVAETDDEFVVKASVPGVNADDIEITMSDNTLTIKGEMHEDKEIDEGDYHLRERRTGSFYRSLTLPAPVNADAIEAVNESGVLTLHLPKAETAKPKKIAVKKMVDAA